MKVLYIITKDMPKIMSSNITTSSNYSTLCNSLCFIKNPGKGFPEAFPTDGFHKR